MKTFTILSFCSCLIVWTDSFPSNNYQQPEGYFQYINVPGPKEYEFGWNKGNPHHYISRFEQAKDHTFRTRVKWADAHDGYGEHYYEYNHSPKETGYGSTHHVNNEYQQPIGYHSENIEVVVDPNEYFERNFA